MTSSDERLREQADAVDVVAAGRPVTRPRHLRRIGWVMLGFAVVALGIAVYMGVWGWRLQTQGLTADAVVVGNQERVDRQTNGQTVTRYAVRFRFEDEQGVTHTVVAKSSTGKPAEIGAPLRVRYLADEPERATPDSWAHVWLPVFVAGPMALVCGVLGLMVLKHAPHQAADAADQGVSDDG